MMKGMALRHLALGSRVGAPRSRERVSFAGPVDAVATWLFRLSDDSRTALPRVALRTLAGAPVSLSDAWRLGVWALDLFDLELHAAIQTGREPDQRLEEETVKLLVAEVRDARSIRAQPRADVVSAPDRIASWGGIARSGSRGDAVRARIATARNQVATALTGPARARPFDSDRALLRNPWRTRRQASLFSASL